VQDQGSYSITVLLTKIGCVAVGISYIGACLRWKCFGRLRLWLMVGCRKWQVVTRMKIINHGVEEFPQSIT
jgi:hypothetical protein